MGKVLKNVSENQISSKPNLDELFNLSQQRLESSSSKRTIAQNMEKPLEKEREKNELVSKFDLIFKKASNPYESHRGRAG